MSTQRLAYRIALRALIAAVGLVPVARLCADSQQSEPDTSVPVASVEGGDGFWPTPKLTRLLVQRWVLETAETYDLSPDQQQRLESQMLDRWPAFFDDNRAEMQPLVNEYLELRMGVEPPTADQVAKWAARAMPVLDRIRDEIEDAQQQAIDLLDSNQRQQFEAQRGRTAAAMTMAEGMLKQWSVGSFRVQDVWDEPKGAQRGAQRHGALDDQPGRAEPPLDRGAALPDSQAPTRVDRELREWERYVADFCDRYELDRSQRNAADSILREMLSRADDHVRLHRERILAVEQAIESPLEQDQAGVEKELDEVYGPIDAMFRELDERIHRLPTEGQLWRVQLEEGYDGAGWDQRRKQEVPSNFRQSESNIDLPPATQPDQP